MFFSFSQLRIQRGPTGGMAIKGAKGSITAAELQRQALDDMANRRATKLDTKVQFIQILGSIESQHGFISVI